MRVMEAREGGGKSGKRQKRDTNALRDEIAKNIGVHCSSSVPVEVSDGCRVRNVVVWQYYTNY